VEPDRNDERLWNGEEGAGGISWADRSRMGPLRGVIDAADTAGRRNAYLHALHLEALRHELARVGRSTTVLDFGCGTGRFIEVLSSCAARVVATDKEPAMVEAARLYAGHYGAEIVPCDVASTPFDAGAFDLTLCSSVLHVAVRRLVPEIVRELARVTTPGGTLLLLEQVADDRGLTVAFYDDALSRAGFKVLRAYPIRPAKSFFTQLAARRHWIPQSWFPKLATLELILTRRVTRTSRSGYMQFTFVARR
jgi:ubiquinone/menaquinone biosynthesis C-methylase UbiE